MRFIGDGGELIRRLRDGGKRSKMICFHGQGLTTRDADMLLEGMSREEQREARQANLSHNDLDESPPALAYMGWLEALWMAGNMIERLGAATRLMNLRLLDLSDNRLNHRPAALGKLTLLEELFLRNNMLRGLPREAKRLIDMRV
jgi:hypothetical protein